MKTTTQNTRTSGLKSRPEQVSTGNRRDLEKRRANRSLNTENLLALLRHETPKFSDLLALTEQHRELWREVQRRTDLKRILALEVDLIAAPLTVAEEEFLNMVIVHFNTGWLLARQGAVLNLKMLAADARDFFRLPLPKEVWNQTKRARDPAFVRFIERCQPGHESLA